jgi:hypothetical protein
MYEQFRIKPLVECSRSHKLLLSSSLMTYQHNCVIQLRGTRIVNNVQKTISLHDVFIYFV